MERRDVPRRLLALVLPLLLLTACGGKSEPAPAPVAASASAPASLAPSTAPGTPERRTVSVGGTARPYLLVRPPAGAAVLGAVLVLHAQNQTMSQAQSTYGLAHLPGRGQLVAYLGGYKGSWNSGGCCGAAKAEGVDDLGYLRAVLADLRPQLPAGRPASLMGYSSGAMLAYAAVCHADLGLRLVLSVSGTRSSGCSTAALPYRFVELHGARDATIPLDPPARKSSLLGIVPVPARPATVTLAKAAGCTRTVDGGAQRTDHGGCRGGGVVRLLVKPGVGHSYSDLGAPVVLTRALEEVGQTTP
ncbi:MAG: lpqP [Frankiales bacterium]|nr:lpqP [Frankiales bacterium]